MKGCLKASAWAVGLLIAIPILIVVFTYFFFHPTGKTPVNLTVIDRDDRPIPNATLTLVQSGQRLFLPVPFGPSRRVERTEHKQTDSNGWCRFYARDQHCNLTRIEISGQPRRVVRYVHHTGEQGNDPRAPVGWRLAEPPYEYTTTIVIE